MPNADAKMGSGDCPANPLFANEFPLPAGLINGQIVLRVLEFRQEAVLEDIHLVQVFTKPGVVRLVAHIADFKRAAASQLPLDAEVPVFHVRLADVRVHREE